ncbi:MaoC family dehydratase [Oceanibaculum pacificum]|uniref:Dehydratase n=1 Tax=Oceanibaculum pacificum TaxID=580166 RepID=A0A154WF57_9PROT|nr:dehydratase [Oceanibaculum pacificum]
MTEELRGAYIDEVSIGQTAVFSKTITETDIILFSGISGDTNPLHLDADYAATTPFKRRIAHGMLSASLLSGVLGTKLPGPGCIYVSQSLNFRAPVRPGDTVVARATVTRIDAARRQVVLETTCTVADAVVLDGEALVMLPKRAPA